MDSEGKDDRIINGCKPKCSGVVGVKIEGRVIVSDFSESRDMSYEKVFATELDIQTYP
jgi:hypothetical protein